MGHVKLGEKTVTTFGDLPATGSTAPDFELVTTDLKEVTQRDYEDKNILMNIFPSIDTSVCAKSVREFNKRAASIKGAVVLCISKDLPFAHRRFCAAEGIDKVITLSDFRNKGFADTYGVAMMDGPMAGLHARAIVIIDKQNKVVYTELVPVIGQEPNYEAALKALSDI